jgi:hypothetical protein
MATVLLPSDDFFDQLSSTAFARFNADGTVAAANDAFRRSAGANHPRVWFGQPTWQALIDLRAKSESPVLHDGLLTVRPQGGEVATLRGRVYRTADGLCVLAESDLQHQLLHDVEERDATIDRLRDELAAVERLSAARTNVTADAYGLTTLRESVGPIFEQLVAEFGRLLGQAMDRRGFRVDHAVSDGVRDLGERLGRLGGGPRDVIDIYRAALDGSRHGVAPAKARAYTEEGRLLVLELMGSLVSYYRRQALPPGASAWPGSARRD